MAVPEQTPYKEFTANGITKVFPLEFDVLEQDHLIVLVNDLEPTVGSWSLDAQNDTVVFALPPANGANIKIRRDTPLSRSTDYESYNNSFRPKPVNDDMDNIWRKLQEMGVINWMIDNNIKDLNEYVDGLNDETKAIFLQMIQEQGTSLEQLDAYVDQLYKNLAEVAADNGWFAEFVADGDENQKQINDKTIQNVENILDLKTISARKNGQVVYVKSIGKNYKYDQYSTAIENNVTIVGKWEMALQDRYYASWFATPNVKQEQQDKLMIGYAYAASKRKPFVIDDKFYVQSTRKQSGFYNQVHYALVVLSNSSLIFSENAVLIHLDTSQDNYVILSCYGADAFSIVSPKLIGDKDSHIGTTGEWGYGLAVTGCSNGIISNPDISKCWGDGIYIGQEYYNNSAVNLIPKNIKIILPTINDVRRNGISLSAADGLYIDAPYINNIKGAAPEACIDIEPEEGLALRSYLRNVKINNATLLNGNSYGVLQWIANSRDVNVQFTGTTTISGSYYTLATTTNAINWDNVSCSGEVKYDHLVYDQRISNSTAGVFVIANAGDGKGIPTIINTLDIHTIFESEAGLLGFEVAGTYGKVGEFKVNSLNLFKHKANHKINFRSARQNAAIISNISLPIPVNEMLYSFESTGSLSCDENVSIGGYSKVTANMYNSEQILTNTTYFTPLSDGSGALYTRIATPPKKGRRLKYILDPASPNIGYGLQAVVPSYLNVPRVECVDMGGFIEIDNRTDTQTISNIFMGWKYGNVIIN
jgi:hypothetical protein